MSVNSSHIVNQFRIEVDKIAKLPNVIVTFADHVTGVPTPLTCEVYGKLLHQDHYLTIIICWLPKSKDPDEIKENWEVVCLLTSCVTEIQRLTKGRKLKVRR